MTRKKRDLKKIYIRLKMGWSHTQSPDLIEKGKDLARAGICTFHLDYLQLVVRCMRFVYIYISHLKNLSKHIFKGLIIISWYIIPHEISFYIIWLITSQYWMARWMSRKATNLHPQRLSTWTLYRIKIHSRINQSDIIFSCVPLVNSL